MSKVGRYAVPMATLLLALAAVGARVGRPAPADPCEATPEIHACAMFRQPEWMIQRAQAGRALARPALPEPATTGALDISARAEAPRRTEAAAGL